MKPRILIIGLDAATLDLVSGWAGGGQLPVLQKVMHDGTSCPFLSTPNMHSASAWTSILTGLNPGRHGLFVFSDRDFVTGKVEFFTGGDRTGQLLTQHLATHGLSSGLLNVPMTYPASCIAPGFAVSGLDAPSLNESAFSPANLRSELLDRFPDYNFGPPGLGDLMRAGRVNEATQRWLDLIETQTAAAEYLLETRPVDFFMTVFTASDWGGHNLWPENNAKETASDDDTPLLSIYKALDRAIGRLVECAATDATIYVVSDHGMGPHTGASYHLAEWLENRGYMQRRRAAPSASSMVTAARNAARRTLPTFVKEKLKAGIGADRVKQLQSIEKDSFYSSIDWERTRAYSEPGRHVININLAGRNLSGTVPPSQFDEIRDNLIADLADWTDEKGRSVVDHVVKREDVYKGPFAEKASDLYVHWNPRARFNEPPAEVQARGFWWRGDHRPHGILVCKGPAIQASHQISPPIVYDLVPTIMYLAGLPVPDNLDGRVILEMCGDEFRRLHPLRFEEAESADGSERAALTDTEEDVVAEKLRGLGYI
ncbi:MAG TPA: alkaline phosphatase family protein [Blastocatellia bacterium]